MNGRGLTEAQVAVSAGAVKTYAIAQAARSAHDGVARVAPVQRHESVHIHIGIAEKVLHTAKVAFAFFTHRRDKEDVAFGLDVQFLEHADDLQKTCQAAGVVTDRRRIEHIAFLTDLKVRVFSKDRVQVSRNNEFRTGFGTDAGAQAQDVTHFIHVNVLKTELREAFNEILASQFFTEGRGGGFGDGNLFFEALLILIDCQLQSLLNEVSCHQRVHHFLGFRKKGR